MGQISLILPHQRLLSNLDQPCLNSGINYRNYASAPLALSIALIDAFPPFLHNCPSQSVLFPKVYHQYVLTCWKMTQNLLESTAWLRTGDEVLKLGVV